MNEFEAGYVPEPPYWEFREPIGEALIEGERRPLYLRLHAHPESYRLSNPLLPVRPEGRRTYAYARPYVEVPNLSFTARVDERPVSGRLGRVERIRRGPNRPLDLGNAQAWYYPDDDLIVLWECYLDEAYRAPDPLGDGLLATVWEGFERSLVGRFPAARILTPAWEPYYEPVLWREFLSSRGYKPYSEQLMTKELPPVL